MEKVAGHLDDGSIHKGRRRESISWWMDNDCECALESFFTTLSACFYWMSSSFMAALTPTMRRWPAGGHRCGWRSAPVGSALPCTCGPLWLRWSWSTEILIKTPSVGALLRLLQQCCPFSPPPGGSLTGRSILDDGSPAATPGLMWCSVMVWHVKRSPTLDVLVVSNLYFFRLLQCCDLIPAFLVVLAVVLLLHQLVYHH